MKLVDANVLIYAVDRGAAHHLPAKSWLDDALSGNETVGFAWIVLLAFLRLTTSPRIFESPLATTQALDVVRGWLASPTSVIVSPRDDHLERLGWLLEQSGTRGNLVSDAHLAAIALDYKATVITFDHDFKRFEGVDSRSPRG